MHDSMMPYENEQGGCMICHFVLGRVMMSWDRHQGINCLYILPWAYFLKCLITIGGRWEFWSTLASKPEKWLLMKTTVTSEKAVDEILITLPVRLFTSEGGSKTERPLPWTSGKNQYER